MLLLLLEGIHFFFFFDKLVSWMPCAVCVCVCVVCIILALMIKKSSVYV
jgi:hypothetical protein